MKIHLNLALIPVFLMLACENQLMKTNHENLPALPGNEFVLTTDRVAQHPDVQFPHDSLTESDYVAVETHASYIVEFSTDGINITISDTISGSRISYGAECSKYDITDGLFAGGRFLVWKNVDRYEAEYTIYGSGVPVIRSERGELIKK